MSVRHVEKNAPIFIKENYLEPIQYVLNTENIFPYDFYDGKAGKFSDNKKTIEEYDEIFVHPDRVIRQELFTNYDQPVKADLKKRIPG